MSRSLPRMRTLRALLPAAALTLGAVLPASAEAQRERLVIRADLLGEADIDAPANTAAPRRTAAQSVQVNAAQRFIPDPDGGTLLLLGAQWRGVRADLPSATPVPVGAAVTPDPTDLHVLTADLWLLRTLDDRHTVVTVLRPGLYGDLGELGDQFRLEGVAFIDRLVSSRATVGLGLSYASAFGEVLTVPVLHVVARPRRQILVDALLPSRLDVWWLPRRGLDLGLSAALAGAQYALTGERRVADATALQFANATVGPRIRWTPSGSKWQVTADAGVTVLRRLRYVDGDRELLDLAPGNVPYARIGLQRLF